MTSPSTSAVSSTPAAPRSAARLTSLTGSRSTRRSTVDRVARGLALVATILCLVPLLAVILFVTIKGLPAVDIALLTKPPRATGVGGGAVTAILGSIQLVALGAAMAIPFGIAAGVYLSEFAGPRAARSVRFAADTLVGIPSILIGIFVFTILVLPFRQYNAFAGSIALALIMVPVIMRTTEEMLRLVPDSLREASEALGIVRWRTVVSIVLRTGLPGVVTGVLLALARAAGETAPLLFTALGSRIVNVGGLGRPMDAMPLFIYNNARSPFPVLNNQAWGVAFLLLVFVLVVNIAVRARTTGRRPT